jgi:hypothetical protein
MVEWAMLVFTIGAYFLGFFFIYRPQTKFQEETVKIAQTQTDIQKSMSEVRIAKDQILTKIAMIEEKTKELEKDLALKEMRLKATLDAYKAIQDIRPKIIVTGLAGVMAYPDREPNILRFGNNNVEMRFLIKNVGSYDAYLSLPKTYVWKVLKEDAKSLTGEVQHLEENRDYKAIYVGPHLEFPAHPGADHRSALTLWFKELDENGEYYCKIEWEIKTMGEIVRVAKIFLKDLMTSGDLDRMTRSKYSTTVRLVIEEMPEGF